MGSLYAYSLLPVLSVALLLFFTALRHGRGARGLAAYCLAVAVWTTMLTLIWMPTSLGYVGERCAAIGAFIAAAYLHAAYEITHQTRFGLVYAAYAIAAAITAAGIVWPGVIYGPRAMTTGPLFWPTMALAVTSATVPLYHLAKSYQRTTPIERPRLRRIFVAGILGDLGGMSNALLLAHGLPLPFGMLLVLASLLVLANVIREHERASERKLLERSLLYSAMAAFLSAGFLFGVMSLMSRSEPFLAEYRAGALILFFTALLAFEPLRQQIQEAIGRRMIKHRAPASDLAEALAREEQRADHAGRLRELGTFASAVAHEVRNPLGVLAANLKILERTGEHQETIAAMNEQIDRAARFVDDLLKYGRPRALELRLIDLGATAALALSTARQGLGMSSDDVEIVVDNASQTPIVEADQAQISQVLVVLLDNALISLADLDRAKKKTLAIRARTEGDLAVLTVEDSGPGVPPELMPRIFQPFVSGRKREGPRSGTGLGLAIARAIVERHHGRITAGRSELGGAKFEVVLPRVQPVLAGSRIAEEEMK
jgi:signal transduction histidine kinase